MFGNLCNIQLSTHYCSYTVCLKEVLNLCTDVRLLCACDRGYKRWVPLIRTSRWEDTASSSASLRKLQGKPTFLSVTTKVTHEVLSQNTNVLNVDVLVSHSLFFYINHDFTETQTQSFHVKALSIQKVLKQITQGHSAVGYYSQYLSQNVTHCPLFFLKSHWHKQYSTEIMD